MFPSPPQSSPAPSYNLVRVMSASTVPFAPEEVSELARVDVAVDDSGVGVGEVLSHSFGFFEDGEQESVLEGCTPMHLAFNVWGHGSPDALVAHDAASAGVVFGAGLTRRLPWISLHLVARKVWPEAADYSLEGLVRWRASLGAPHGAGGGLPTGAGRDALLTAHLLSELLRDPALRPAGRLQGRRDAARHRRAGAVLGDMVRSDGLQAAVRISSQPGPPLRQPPGPWDDQRDWAGYGREDLSWFARGMCSRWVGEAARGELARRARAAAGPARGWRGILLRRTVAPVRCRGPVG